MIAVCRKLIYGPIMAIICHLVCLSGRKMVLSDKKQILCRRRSLRSGGTIQTRRKFGRTAVVKIRGA